MFQRKYLLTDLDGTLLQPDATLSERSRRAVTLALEQGHVISYATARSYTSASKAVSGVPWLYPVLLYNGAVLYDPVKRMRLGGYLLDPDIADQVMEQGRDHGILPLLFAFNEKGEEKVHHEPLTHPGMLAFRRSRIGDPRFAEVEKLAVPVGWEPIMLTYIGIKQELQPFKDFLEKSWGEQIHLHMMPDSYIKDHYFLEISHPKAQKREGLKLWARTVGCVPEEVAAVGDNLNDLGMLEAAGMKLAVANAHPELLRRAQQLLPAHSEDGVAAFIEAWCLGRESLG